MSASLIDRYLLLHFLHSNIAFGQGVRKWNAEVAHESQDLISIAVETIKQIFSLVLFLAAAFALAPRKQLTAR